MRKIYRHEFGDLITNAMKVRALTAEELDTVSEDNGYYLPAVYGKLGIEDGDIAAGIDSSGRRVFILGTKIGNVILFERCSEGTDLSLAWNAPTILEKIFGDEANDLRIDLFTDGDGRIDNLVKKFKEEFE